MAPVRESGAIEPAPEVSKQIASVQQRAEDLVRVQIPVKIAEISKILDSEFGDNAFDLSASLQAAGIAESDANGHNHPAKPQRIPCNERVLRQHALAKPHFLALRKDTLLLKVWIQLLIPKIEDGNNFGVSIQVDIIAEIRSAADTAIECWNYITNYYYYRAGYIKKAAKYPHIDDWRELVREYDENQLLFLRLNLELVRDCYVRLHDLISKNYDKIVCPRTTNSENLY